MNRLDEILSGVPNVARMLDQNKNVLGKSRNWIYKIKYRLQLNVGPSGECPLLDVIPLYWKRKAVKNLSADLIRKNIK